MSNRSRQSVTQPQSYKDFSETGHREAIPEGASIEQSQLMHENNLDESRPSTAGETSNGSSSKPETNASNSKHETTNDSEITINLTSRRKTYTEQSNNKLRSRSQSSHDEHDMPGKRRRTNTKTDRTYV